MLTYLLITLGVFTRLIPHGWNFTPVLAIGLFAGCYLNRKWAVITPLILLFVTDIALGFHETMPFTWGSMIIISLWGTRLKNRLSMTRVLLSGLVASIFFFLFTNFGAWLFIYPRTLAGFSECFTLAIPFFRNTLLSTWVYSAVLFGLYEWAASKVKNTSLEKILIFR